MDSSTLQWLIAQLGPDTDPADLAQRYDRLGSARAVAGEVLHERIAALISEPLRVTVNGVATIASRPTWPLSNADSTSSTPRQRPTILSRGCPRPWSRCR
ncbi:hypothetical protein [Streptomyces virginiae]|uniref:hypothetical protein n=1 Tax=Streptomyces virginiae TaxID=1961 RepID=UPI00365EAB99